MAIIANTSGSIAKNSIGYLSTGQEFDQAIINWDGTGSIEYFSTSSTDNWSTTTIKFAAGNAANNTTGNAVYQITTCKDGKAFVTLFEQGSQSSNVTYLFDSVSAANNAISTNNYSGNAGAVSFANGQSTGIGSAVNFTQSGADGNSDWLGNSDALSGVQRINWYEGLVNSPLNVAVDTAPVFLGGSNNAANQEAITRSQDLANAVVDPLVLNLRGGPVTTTALGSNGVKFDTKGTGTSNSTGWISAGEGFLVYDPSGGAITSGSQFITSLDQLAKYGVATVSGSQSLSASELAALGTPGTAQYEANLSKLASVVNNGGVEKVTAAEASDLRVWVPGKNGAGGQLYTLQQLGISEIDLAATVVGKTDHGNEINSTFNFVYNNGTVGQGADITLEVAPSLPLSTASQVNNMVAATASLGGVSGTAGNDMVIASQQLNQLTPNLAATLH